MALKGQKSPMKGKQYKRHWYMIRKPGDRSIRALISAFSPKHIKQKAGLKDTDVTIHKARRWHLVRVFSGSAIFYDYVRKIPKKGFSTYHDNNSEDVEAYVENEFHMILDDKKILVKILS